MSSSNRAKRLVLMLVTEEDEGPGSEAGMAVVVAAVW